MLVIDALTIRRGGGLVLLTNMVSSLARDSRIQVHLLCNSQVDVTAIEQLENITIVRLASVSSALDAVCYRKMRLKGYLDRLPAKVTLLSFNSGSRSEYPQITVHINTIPFLPWIARAKSVGILRSILLKRVSGKALKHSVINIFESQYLLDLARKSFGQDIRNPVVRYFGSDLPRPAVPVDYSSRKNRLISVTSAASHKQNNKVVNAYLQIQKKYPDVELLFVGNEELIRADLARSHPELDYSGVSFSGYLSRDELAEELGKSRLLISLSTTESFYLIAVEAMFCGTPVIAMRIASAVESCGVHARLIDDDFPETVLRAYEELNDKGAWNRYSKGGYDYSHKFQLAECMDRITRDIVEGIALRSKGRH